jgi:hypothetical protein
MLKKWLKQFVVNAVLQERVWLYDLLESERKRRAAEDLRAILEERDRRQRQINDDYVGDRERKQAVCSHTKGGRGLKGPSVDYNVSQFTFANGQTVTKCLTCDKRFEGPEAAKMMDRSTNTTMSSERVFKFENRERPEAVPRGKLQKIQQDFMDAPLSPYISPSLWDRMMTRLAKLKKRKKRITA